MKKFSFTLGLALFFTVIVTLSPALSQTVCPSVSIVGIGTAPVASGILITVKNESGQACGDLAHGATMQYALSDTNADQHLAILLTAYGLGKKLYIIVGGTGSSYSLLYDFTTL